jgi:hypothetical protein
VRGGEKREGEGWEWCRGKGKQDMECMEKGRALRVQTKRVDTGSMVSRSLSCFFRYVVVWVEG